MLSEDGYHLHDIEAVSFIPFLINKVGCATQTQAVETNRLDSRQR